MKKKNAHRTIHLHIYMGKHGIKGIAKGENGKVVNDNHLVKLTYGSFSWDNYMKNLQASGIIKVDVVGFLKKDYKEGAFEYDEAKGVQAEVDAFMTVQAEVAQTPDQKKIAELEAKLDTLLAASEGKANEAPKEEDPAIPAAENVHNPDDKELVAAQKRWEELKGKAPHHMKQLKGLNLEIAEMEEAKKADAENGAPAEESEGEGENQNTGTPAAEETK